MVGIAYNATIYAAPKLKKHQKSDMEKTAKQPHPHMNSHNIHTSFVPNYELMAIYSGLFCIGNQGRGEPRFTIDNPANMWYNIIVQKTVQYIVQYIEQHLKGAILC